jgi:hypothetical protein
VSSIERRTPEQILQQRMAALQNANRVRLGRSDRKRELRLGNRSIADLLGDPNLQTMSVALLLRQQPWWGKTRVNNAMRYLELPMMITVGKLTERRRAALIAYANEHRTPAQQRKLATTDSAA